MAFRVVLDTCVLVPLPLRDTLLTLAAAELFVAKWSERSLASMERVLVEERRLDPKRAAGARAAIALAFEDASVSAGRVAALEPAMTNPEHDRHVLAAAVASNAEKIVTFNVRDFPAAACEPVGIEALTPDEFLCDLLVHAPDVVLRGLEAQAGRLVNPSMTVLEVVDGLESAVPEFARAIRDRLSVE